MAWSRRRKARAPAPSLGGQVDRVFRLQFAARPVDRAVPGAAALRPGLCDLYSSSLLSKKCSHIVASTGLKPPRRWVRSYRTGRAANCPNTHRLAASEARSRALRPPPGRSRRNGRRKWRALQGAAKTCETRSIFDTPHGFNAVLPAELPADAAKRRTGQSCSPGFKQNGSAASSARRGRRARARSTRA